MGFVVMLVPFCPVSFYLFNQGAEGGKPGATAQDMKLEAALAAIQESDSESDDYQE